MKSDFLERYSTLQSPIHRLNVRAKVFVAVLLLLTTILLPPGAWIAFIGIAGILATTAALSKIPAGYLLRRMLFIEPIILSMAILTLFRPNGPTVFFVTIIKATICLCTMILLSSTTPFSRLIGLAQRWHLPALLVNIVGMMYRYIFVLIDETERMQRARNSRTFTTQKRRRWISLSQLVGQIFVRSTERAERIYAAMCARGWK
jgi:cobalt/nickel transport system permease protein